MQYDINYIQFLFREHDRLCKKMSSLALSIFSLNVKDHNQKKLVIELASLREEKKSVLLELNDYAHDVWVNDKPLNIKSI